MQRRPRHIWALSIVRMKTSHCHSPRPFVRLFIYPLAFTWCAFKNELTFQKMHKVFVGSVSTSRLPQFKWYFYRLITINWVIDTTMTLRWAYQWISWLMNHFLNDENVNHFILIAVIKMKSGHIRRARRVLYVSYISAQLISISNLTCFVHTTVLGRLSSHQNQHALQQCLPNGWPRLPSRRWASACSKTLLNWDGPLIPETPSTSKYPASLIRCMDACLLWCTTTW